MASKSFFDIRRGGGEGVFVADFWRLSVELFLKGAAGGLYGVGGPRGGAAAASACNFFFLAIL